MKELGIPRSVAVPAGGRPCGHAAPTFGCKPCFEDDRDAARGQAFTDWAKTYKPPKYSDCGGPMVVDNEWWVNAGLLKAVVICASGDPDLPCDSDIEVIIP